MNKNARGLLKLTRNRAGFLCDPAQMLGELQGDIQVSARLVREHGLVEGAIVSGPVRRGKRGDELADVVTVCGLTPAAFRDRTPFTKLTAISPNERFRLAAADEVSMRVVDLVAPIGKGTRGLIVAPPKAGKTRLLEEIAHAIHVDDPETRVILLLIDERPEEVTHFRRTMEAEVFASSNDRSTREHLALCELTLAHVRTELECGRNIVLLVDSMTRLVRAFNLSGRRASRTMSGGIEAGALEVPRRLFGLARNIEHGGSATVIGTVLVETGSAMDDLIFEEFKSTGNSEIVLDRSLAEARLFPAINVQASGTRREEELYSTDEYARLVKLHRWLASGPPKAALNSLLKLMAQVPTNEELLARIRV